MALLGLLLVVGGGAEAGWSFAGNGSECKSKLNVL